MNITAWVIPVCNNIVGCFYISWHAVIFILFIYIHANTNICILGFCATVYAGRTVCVETGRAYRFNIVPNTFHIRRFGCKYFTEKTFSSFLPRKKGSINLLFMLLKDLQEFKRRYSY